MKSHLLIILIIALLCINEDQASSQYDFGIIGIAYHSCSENISKDSVLIDGIKNHSSFEMMSTECEIPELVRFNVKIPPVKNIGSVTVYSGDCDDCDGLLNNFLVKLFSVKDSSSKGVRFCGQYNGEFLEPEHPMTVNCDVKNNYDETMIMIGIFPNDYQKTVSKKSAVSEIDVHLLEYSRDLAFFGCYEAFDGEIVSSRGNCRTTCARLGHRFMSLSYENECKCGSKIPSRLISNSLCDDPCEEHDLVCSAHGVFSVYLARAPHIYSHGCYSVPTSLKPGYAHHSSNMTSIWCIKLCSTKNYTFSYVSVFICYCTEQVKEDKQDAHLCNITCPGDDSRCGGKDVVSVYGGCMDNSGQSPCTSVYNCEKNNFDQFGKCLGPCKTGWRGQYCLSRALPDPPAGSRRIPLPSKPTRLPDTRLWMSIECRQAIRSFYSQRITKPKDRCLNAVDGFFKKGISAQSVLIIIFFSLVIACASGVASYVLDGSLCFKDAVQFQYLN